jgi:hypothetical protein
MKGIVLASPLFKIFFRRSEDSRVVVHVGPSKTGSSAIQEALNRERQQLKLNGILYPEHSIDENMISSGHVSTIMTFRDSHWKPSLRKILRVRRDFSKSNCHSMILTSEFFCEKDVLLALSALLDGVTAVSFVRDPISLVSSEYIQSVKRANETQNIRIDNDFVPWFYHRLEACSRMEVPFEYVLYPNTQLESESIATPILTIAGYTGNPILCKWINTRYSLEALLFKRAANHYLGPELLIHLDKLLQRAPFGCRNYSVLSAEGQDGILRATSGYLARLRTTDGESRLAEAIELSVQRFMESANSHNYVENIVSNQMSQLIDYIGTADAELLEQLLHAVASQPVPSSVPQMFLDEIHTQV